MTTEIYDNPYRALDVDEATLYLNTLDPTARKFLIVTLPDPKSLKDSPRGRRMTKTFIIDLDDASAHETWEKIEALNNQGAGVFVLINRKRVWTHHGRKATDIKTSNCICIDVDDMGEYVPPPLQPTFSVYSSPGKVHHYWILNRPLTPDLFCDADNNSMWEDMMQYAAWRYKGDTGACKRTQIMRLPGSWHMKNKPILVHSDIATLGEPVTYPWLQLAKIFKYSKIRLLRSKIKKDANRGHGLASMRGLETDVNRIKSVLDFLNKKNLRDVIEEVNAYGTNLHSDGYQWWIRVGMAIRQSGVENGLDMWLDWSRVRANWESEHYAIMKWNSFSDGPTTIGTLYAAAKSCGWDYQYEGKVVPIPEDEIEEIKEDLGLKEELRNYDEIIPRLPPLIKELYHAIHNSMIYQQSAFALFTTFWLFGAMINRGAVMKFNGNRIYTNLYMKMLGPTGCGKDPVIYHSSTILRELGYDVATSIGSSEGLEDWIYMNDGIGFVVTDEARPKALRDGNSMKIVDKENELFTSTGRDLHPRKLVKNDEKPPAKNLFYMKLSATTTQAHFDIESMARAVSGEAGRLLLVMADEARPKGNFDNVTEMVLPPAVKAFGKFMSTVDKVHVEPGTDIMRDTYTVNQVTVSEEARRLWIKRQNELDKKLNDSMSDAVRAMVVRLGTYAATFSMIIAIARDEFAYHVEAEDMKLAIDIMRIYANKTRVLVDEHVADSRAVVIANRIYSLLKGAMSRSINGRIRNQSKEDYLMGGLRVSAIADSLRVSSFELNEAIKTGQVRKQFYLTEKKKSTGRTIEVLCLYRKR